MKKIISFSLIFLLILCSYFMFHSDNKIIDLKFIKKYYSGEDRNKYKNLTGELRNNSNVKVILPSIDILTQDFCDACAIFIEVIKAQLIVAVISSVLAFFIIIYFLMKTTSKRLIATSQKIYAQQVDPRVLGYFEHYYS